MQSENPDSGKPYSANKTISSTSNTGVGGGVGGTGEVGTYGYKET